MPKCRKCGDSMYAAEKGVCRACRRKWLDNRLSAYNETIDEFGNPTKGNLEEFKKLVMKKEQLKNT